MNRYKVLSSAGSGANTYGLSSTEPPNNVLETHINYDHGFNKMTTFLDHTISVVILSNCTMDNAILFHIRMEATERVKVPMEQHKFSKDGRTNTTTLAHPLTIPKM